LTAKARKRRLQSFCRLLACHAEMLDKSTTQLITRRFILKQLTSLNSKRVFLAGICTLLLAAVTIIGISVSAHSIDYVSTSISPAATFNGNSGNWTVKNPVAGGSTISFSLTFSINTQGSTTSFPRTVTFGASQLSVGGLPVTHNFTSASGLGSTFTDNLTITAPTTPGHYNVRIDPISGTGGQNGLTSGGGVLIHFTVATPSTPECPQTATSLSLSNSCITYHEPSTTLSATLTAGGNPLPGKSVDFKVDNISVGTAVTDAIGVAQLSYNTSALSVGDHTVIASYVGDGCNFQASSGSANLGVTYVFVGYQQPINADGSSQFGGRTIPVKIRIVDYNGVSVPDAAAYVFFAFGTPSIVGSDAEPVANTNGDSGNAMRYDATAGQYIFNWDIAGLANGTYTIRVGLGEGECGIAHTVIVSLKKKGSK
jgi:hypothetical protein